LESSVDALVVDSEHLLHPLLGLYQDLFHWSSDWHVANVLQRNVMRLK
jgi:hypothetical protein